MNYDKMQEVHKRFVAGQWPLYGTEDIRFMSLSLCGEVGELANFVKKDWRGDPVDYSKEIIKELVDVRIFT